MKEHLPFIDRCVELAERGRGRTGRNPLVGAVLVRFDSTSTPLSAGSQRDKGEIIAEAFHEAFGAAHAERKLLEDYKGDISPDDILYVNLEPCVHHGKTPPCSDVIIARGVKTVVFGMVDPNPLVKGKGRRALEEAKVRVIGPVDPVRCQRLNRGFTSLQQRGRPWITLKRAQRNNGSITGKITSSEQDAWSHQWLRGRHDAILVGVETVNHDDPQLTNRSTDFQPQRIILDPQLRINQKAKVLRAGTTIITSSSEQAAIKVIESKGATVIGLPDSDDSFDWPNLWDALPDISSILVEGGAETWRRFEEASLVDEEVTLRG